MYHTNRRKTEITRPRILPIIRLARITFQYSSIYPSYIKAWFKLDCWSHWSNCKKRPELPERHKTSKRTVKILFSATLVTPTTHFLPFALSLQSFESLDPNHSKDSSNSCNCNILIKTGPKKSRSTWIALNTKIMVCRRNHTTANKINFPPSKNCKYFPHSHGLNLTTFTRCRLILKTVKNATVAKFELAFALYRFQNVPVG